MKSFGCLLFGILGTSFLVSSNFNCIDGQVLYAKQLSSPYYFQTGAVTSLPLPYAYNSDVTTTPVLAPQRNPPSTFAYQYGAGAGAGTGTGTGVSPLSASMAQYQWYPSKYQTQNKYQQLYQYPLHYTSSGVTDANGYPVRGAVPVQKEVLLEQPFMHPSFVSDGPIQGYYGNDNANNAGFLETTSPSPLPPMVNILEANFPIRTEVDSPSGYHQGNLLPQRVPIPVSVPAPAAHPDHDHLPVHVLKVQHEGEEEAEEIGELQQQHSYDEVLASLMAEAQKNGQTVHSDRYTYGRMSQPLPYRYRYQLVPVPVATPKKLIQYRNRQRGLVKVKTAIQGDRPQHVIKKPFQVQRPHHFEFYDWH